MVSACLQPFRVAHGVPTQPVDPQVDPGLQQLKGVVKQPVNPGGQHPVPEPLI